MSNSVNVSCAWTIRLYETVALLWIRCTTPAARSVRDALRHTDLARRIVVRSAAKVPKDAPTDEPMEEVQR